MPAFWYVRTGVVIVGFDAKEGGGEGDEDDGVEDWGSGLLGAEEAGEDGVEGELG